MQLRLFGLEPVQPEPSLEHKLKNLSIIDVGLDLLGDRMKKQGPNYVGLCPFHDEKTPSFYLKQKGNFARCYGCGRTETAFSLPFEIPLRLPPNKYALTFWVGKWPENLELPIRTDYEKPQEYLRKKLRIDFSDENQRKMFEKARLAEEKRLES